jgi:hypothetical protein
MALMCADQNTIRFPFVEMGEIRVSPIGRNHDELGGTQKLNP